MHTPPSPSRFTAALATLALVAIPALSAHAEEGTEAPAAEVAFDSRPDAEGLEWMACGDGFHEGCGLAILNIDADGRNADVYFRYPAGESFPLHWHTSPERMVVLRGTLQVSYEGQEPVTIEPGDYAFGPGGAHHAGTCQGDEDCLLFIAFEDPPDTHFVTEASE